MGRVLAGAWLYDGDGHHQVADWCAALAQLGDAPGFVWLALDQPAPAELDRLGHELHLHPLAVEDAALGGQRTKLDRYDDDSALLVLHPLDYADATSSIETRDMAVFLGPRHLVTVRRDGYTPLRDARYRLDGAPGPMRVLPVGGLHAVLDSVVDHYVAVADALQDDLDAVERAVFAEDGSVDAPRIYALKREVSEARRAMAPLVRPVAELARGELSWVPKKARPFFSDVLDHLVRAAEQVEAQERALTDVLSVHLTQVSVQQNEDARRISAWAAMALVPTLIAGIYGMNFKDIPELQWHYGYYYALGLMLAVVAVLYRLFKRSGWL